MQSSTKKTGLNFSTVAKGGQTVFFKFDDAENTQFCGKFLRVLPDDNNLEGIEFIEVDPATGENKDENLTVIPSYYQLLNFFKDQEANDKEVFLIELTGITESKKGKLFNFEIQKATL